MTFMYKKQKKKKHTKRTIMAYFEYLLTSTSGFTGHHDTVVKYTKMYISSKKYNPIKINK